MTDCVHPCEDRYHGNSYKVKIYRYHMYIIFSSSICLRMEYTISKPHPLIFHPSISCALDTTSIYNRWPLNTSRRIFRCTFATTVHYTLQDSTQTQHAHDKYVQSTFGAWTLQTLNCVFNAHRILACIRFVLQGLKLCLYFRKWYAYTFRRRVCNEQIVNYLL